MKKIAALLSIITLASCGQLGSKNSQTDNKTPNIPANWKTYSYANYSIKYPPAWTLISTSPVSGGVSTFLINSPNDSSNPYMIGSIIMSEQDIKGRSFSLDSIVGELGGQYKDKLYHFTAISNNKLSDSSGEYQRIIFTGEQGSLKMMFEQQDRIINDKLYILSLVYPKAAGDIEQKIGEQILGSFVVKK
jgi:hypothetical protein